MPDPAPPPEFTRQDRLEYIAKHQDLWDQPRELVWMMRARGLYSSIAPARDQVGYVSRAIAKLRGEW